MELLLNLINWLVFFCKQRLLFGTTAELESKYLTDNCNG